MIIFHSKLLTESNKKNKWMRRAWWFAIYEYLLSLYSSFYFCTVIVSLQISMNKPSRSRPPSWADRPVWLGVCDGGKAERLLVPHTFHIHTYTKPTMCQHCHRLLKGLFRQGLQCSGTRSETHPAQPNTPHYTSENKQMLDCLHVCLCFCFRLQV